MNASHDQFVTGLVFCLGGAGYLAMLSADGRERIRVWGRLVSLWRSAPRYAGAFDEDDGRADAPRRVRGRGPGPDTRALAAAGRRVGLASIVLALCAPLLLPGLHPSKLFSSGPGIGGNGGGSGGLSLSLPSALAQTVTQLRETHPSTVFTYTTSASQAQQSNDAEYFRQYVFDTLAEDGWQVSDYTAHTVPIELAPRPPGPDRRHGGSDRDDDGHRQPGLPQPRLAADVPAAALSGHPRLRARKVAGRPRPHGVLHQRLHRRPVLLGGERRGGSEPGAAGVGARSGEDGDPGGGSAASLVLPDDGAEESGGQLHGRPDQRIRQGGRAGELALGRAVQLQPHRGAVEQRGEPAELPDQDEERLLRAVRLRDDRADPPARHPGPVRGRLHGGHPAQERQLRGQEHRRARVDRGVLPDLRLDPLRAHAGRPGHREPAELHDRRDGARPVRRDQPDHRGDRRGGQQEPQPEQQRRSTVFARRRVPAGRRRVRRAAGPGRRGPR